MTTAASKIDSNVTGLRYAKEATLGVLPGSPTWYPLEPNSYKEFGGDNKLVSRNPINSGRSRKKGVLTDLNATGGFMSDITQTNLQDVLQGLLFAAFRRKVETGQGAVTAITSVSATQYVAAGSLTAFRVNDLVKGNNFTNSTNNSMQRLTTVTGTALTTAGALVAEASPPSNSYVSQVGFQFTAGDALIDVTTGPYPRLKTTTKDCTQFGLTPGEIIFIGGDSSLLKFSASVNNGFCRVRSVATNYIEFDKTASTMIASSGDASQTVQIFFGRVLRNETGVGASIVRSSYQVERTLGASDLDNPTQIQSEYVIGAVPNEGDLDIPTADKITFDISFMGTTTEVRSGVTGVKSGTRPALVEADAFNTSSDVSKIKLAQVVANNACPSSLFSYIDNLKINIKNNCTPNKAVAVLGAFDISAGTFEVSGDINAYFTDIAAMTSVRSNIDATLEAHFVKSNAGMSIDLPLVALSDGRPDVKQDVAVMIPLKMDAATGSKVNTNMDQTMTMVFFDWLPTLADS